MNNRVRKIGGVVLVLALCLGSFITGRVMRDEYFKEFFYRQSYLLESLNSVAGYRHNAEISREISKGNSGMAQCHANLMASVHLRGIRKCMADNECRETVHDELTKQAPELLETNNAQAAYFENIDRCSPTNPDGRGVEPPCTTKRPKCGADHDEGRLQSGTPADE